jgi:Cytochrome c2
MKQLIPIYCCVLLLSVSTDCFSQKSGDALFNSFCNACHTIGKGRLVGPDLANVHNRRSPEWLARFIHSSQSVIREGDPDAIAIFKEYNQTVMPDAPYTTDEIKFILTYIAEKSPGGTNEVAAQNPSPAEEPTRSFRPVEGASESEIRVGQMLFSGKTRLSGGGPSCMSCHHIKNDGLIGGGLLAKDLTAAFSRMNESGIKAIVSNPPFPAMKEAYAGAPITDEEAYALTAFLKQADEQQYNQHPRNYQHYMLGAGALGLVILMTAYSIIWRNRKKQVVNHKIFNRQVKS